MDSALKPTESPAAALIFESIQVPWVMPKHVVLTRVFLIHSSGFSILWLLPTYVTLFLLEFVIILEIMVITLVLATIIRLVVKRYWPRVCILERLEIFVRSEIHTLPRTLAKPEQGFCARADPPFRAPISHQH